MPGLIHDHSAHDAQHSHERHFTHPLLTESPTPDSKIQARYLFTNGEEEDEHELEIHGEYALLPELSIELAIPVTSHDDETDIGNLHGGIKLANFTFEEKGIVLSTMFLIEAPTGDGDEHGHHASDDWSIGIHIGGGWENNTVEVIIFTGLEMPISSEEESENTWTSMASMLHKQNDHLAIVAELSYDRVMNGHHASEDDGFLSAGVAFKPQSIEHTEFGIGLSVPITDSETNFRFILTGLKHF